LFLVVGANEFVHLVLSRVFRDSVPHLNLADQPIFLGIDCGQIVISELSSHLFDFPYGLLPFALDSVPIDFNSPVVIGCLLKHRGRKTLYQEYSAACIRSGNPPYASRRAVVIL
jgi:hypothetical protein